MKLSKHEAYITKTNKINFGSNETAIPFSILNPIKGQYEELENRINNILEINNVAVLELVFDNGKSVWLSNISPNHDKDHTSVVVYYNSIEEAIGKRLSDEYSLSTAKPWNDISSQFHHNDVAVRRVILKGLRL